MTLLPCTVDATAHCLGVVRAVIARDCAGLCQQPVGCYVVYAHSLRTALAAPGAGSNNLAVCTEVLPARAFCCP